MVLEIRKGGQIGTAEGTLNAMVEGTLKTPDAKGLGRRVSPEKISEKRAYMLAGGGDGLVEEHKANFTSEFTEELFLELANREVRVGVSAWVVCSHALIGPSR